MKVPTRLILSLIVAAGLVAVLATVYLGHRPSADPHVWPAWPTLIFLIALEIAGIVAITGLVVRWSVLHGLSRTAAWLRGLRLGLTPNHAGFVNVPAEFSPLTSEVQHLVRSLEAARASAQQEARLRDEGESRWTPERLRASLGGRIGRHPLVVVSNREPYMHVRRGRHSEVLVPASGLVTALEPVLRACDGTWVAHGSGDADRDHVDRRDRVRVPVEQPEYTLRRVWLTEEEESGYYFGFSNEGLWPLCHIAHTRPVFRAADWRAYQIANQRFADAVLDEISGTPAPLILIQDYHFALLPQLIKAARPDARVAIFWHIPWPNPEAFGICPWQRELLDGLLGADLVGFHTQAFCNNFLDTVERAVESRVDWEAFSARRRDHLTQVRPFPISVAFREPAASEVSALSVVREAPAPRANLLAAQGLGANFLAVGVDRLDYTKGILERFRGVERFLENWPDYINEFTLIQIGAPSRSRIKRYEEFSKDVEAEAARINARFKPGSSSTWAPIVLLQRHHSHAEIEPYYRAADVCMVTSLHDGMNLVAKEYVSARDDGDGALILSRFTGAAAELTDALIVNPYDTEEVALAIRTALTMDPADRQARMQRMRHLVREHNVYRWAATLILDLANVRAETQEPAAP